MFPWLLRTWYLLSQTLYWGAVTEVHSVILVLADAIMDIMHIMARVGTME